jgi:hypothetical protein
VKQIRSPIATLAMDGPRVAYASGGTVYVWNVLTGASSTMKGKYSKHTSEVAIAGTRVAWVTRFVVGASLQTTDRLYSASLGSRARQLAWAFRAATYNNDEHYYEWRGDWITGLVGSGDVLAVSRWHSSTGTCTGERLSLITPTGLRQIVTGPGAIMAESGDAGRIAVLRSEDAWPWNTNNSPPVVAPATVGIYSATGKLLREITPSSAKEVALSGDWLTVLTNTKTLEVYNRKTGNLVHTWPVAKATPNLQAGHLATYGELGVYSVDPRRSAARQLHVVQLRTGKDVILATGRGTGYYTRDAAIGPRGLVYAVNYHEHGRLSAPERGKLVFLPLAKVLAKVR